jgi:hypothetical protein
MLSRGKHLACIVALLAVACDRGPVARRAATPTAQSGNRSPAASSRSARDPDRSSVDVQSVPAQVISACDSVEGVMRTAFGITQRADGAYNDSFRGARQLGCRLTAQVSASLEKGGLDRQATVVSLLEVRRWAQDLRYSADGPDGSSVGMRQRDLLCLVMTRSNGADDADTTSVRNAKPDSTDVIVECAHDISSNADGSVPDSLWRIARGLGFDSLYAIDFRLQYPPYLNGDFDGDGVPDAAVLVTERSTGKLGVAFVLRGPHRVVLVGAGTSLEGTSDDLSGLVGWETFRKGSMRNLSIPDVPREALAADGLWISKRDSTSGFIVWTGTGYRWEAPRSPGR